MKKWIAVFFLILVLLFLVLMRGIIVEHHNYYVPVTDSQKQEGAYQPVIVLGNPTRYITIIPFVFYYHSSSPDGTAWVQVYDSTGMLGYERFKSLTFHEFTVEGASGTSALIAQDFPLTKRKFQLCPRNAARCNMDWHDFMKPLPFGQRDERLTFEVKGEFVDQDNKTELFTHKQTWVKTQRFHIAPGIFSME